MPERPYTLLGCGMSIDGYIDIATDERLVLSNDADLDRVDAVRADSDAILVGAATSATTTPGCWCARRRGAPSASPAACRQPDQGDRHQSRSAGPVRRLLRHR
jgi:riboflavin biosynthesis pyrimidine reductase